MRSDGAASAPAHPPTRRGDVKPWASSKLSSTARGYGARWQRIRLQVLERDGYLCQCPECKASGRVNVNVATEVDHIRRKADGGGDDLANLRAVAHECHKRLTIEQGGGTYNRRPAIGLDGFPRRE